MKDPKASSHHTHSYKNNQEAAGAMKIDMLMLLYLRVVDIPTVLIRSWSWEYSKDEAKAEEHLRSPLGRNYTQGKRGKESKIYKALDRKFKMKVYSKGSDYTDCNPKR